LIYINDVKIFICLNHYMPSHQPYLSIPRGR